jgi:hypothetical protein
MAHMLMGGLAGRALVVSSSQQYQKVLPSVGGKALAQRVANRVS